MNKGVTEVKDQGSCGCSWATSLCGVVEGAAFANNGYLQSLSFQQLVSCNERNLGCGGGSLAIAALYASLNRFGGMARLNEYEFTDYGGITTEECTLSPSMPLAVAVSNPKIVASVDSTISFDKRVELFKQVLESQPIAVVMKSSCKIFSNYRSGILTDDGDCACSDSQCLDHAVLMVGYDDTTKPPHFKVKNSWGTKWGEDGYFLVAQSGKGNYGLFGILAQGLIVNAQNVTITIPAEEQNFSLPNWTIVLIALGSSLFCCICFSFVLYKKNASKM
mmetsp:Transcript_12588/g.20280  ORF Transcript_12588/g.20280 Transcript_12588/m.20280 type:complete len:277 (+) Transcript_12588:17-847(+)